MAAQKEETKQKWETPQLVILGRARPEEAVLMPCKAAGTPLDGPNGKDCVSVINHPQCQAFLTS